MKMDDEMINRLIPIIIKHNPQTKIGAAIVLVELLIAMREPTEKMIEAGVFIETAQSGVYSCTEVWQAMLDAIIGDK